MTEQISVRIELVNYDGQWRYTLRSGTFMHQNYNPGDKVKVTLDALNFCAAHGWAIEGPLPVTIPRDTISKELASILDGENQ